MLFSRSLTLAVLGCALLAGGCDRQSGEGAQPQADAAGPAKGAADRSHRGEELPSFSLGDAQGRSLKLQSLRGKPLLINLWATWCAPCIAELPTLNALAHARNGQLRVLTVSQDMSQAEKVAPFLATRGLDRLESWLDPETDMSFHYGTGTLPTTVLYDAEGREVWRFVGDLDWTGTRAAELLKELCPTADPSC